MTPEQAQTRIAALRAEILHHDKLYYQDAAPTLDDAMYDARLRELRDLEAQHPALVTPDSPTQKVGGTVAEGYRKVTHAKPMLSLYTETDFSDQGAFDFTRRVSEFLVSNKITERGDRAYCCEMKFDGLAVTLRYVNGQLVQAATRGDGEVGEDVTANVRHVSGAPTMHDAPQIAVLEVRGEVVMGHDAFTRLNAQRSAAGEKAYVNARNAAAGAMRLLDASKVADRGLQFFAYGVGECSALPVNKQSNLLHWLGNIGFAVHPEHITTKDPFELVAFHQRVLAIRQGLGFDIDGVVYKIDDFELQDKLGFSGREPRWAAAHKFEPEGELTRVLGIDVQIGRTGKVTPVARLKPVFVGGTTVSNVTLSNESEIRRKDIRVGDTVLVQRAGDVIPEIVSVMSRDPQNSQPYVFPTTCPECGSPLIRKEGEIDHRCSGGSVCPAQGLQKLIHFCSRKAMNIEGFGDKLLEKLMESGHVVHPFDLYTLGLRKKAEAEGTAGMVLFYKLSPSQLTQLAYDTLCSLEGIGSNSAMTLLKALEDSKRPYLKKLLYALGIRHASEGTSKRLVKHYDSLSKIQRATQEELEKIKDIGPVVAKSIVDYWADPETRTNVHLLEKYGVEYRLDPADFDDLNAPKPLADLTFVITGSCEGVNREELKARLETQGATVSNTVTAKTDYLIAGLNAGSKMDKAIALGVKTISMEALHPDNFDALTFTEWSKPVTV